MENKLTYFPGNEIEDFVKVVMIFRQILSHWTRDKNL